jgi:ABC-type transport system substrate-binding protein
MACSGLFQVKRVVPIPLMPLLIFSVACTSVATPTPTPWPEGQTFTLSWPPEWGSRGKYQKMVLRGIIGFNLGQWDVHACGTLPDCLMASSPQFNGLVYHNPVNPDEIVCDLCESWTVSPDEKTYTFRLRQEVSRIARSHAR